MATLLPCARCATPFPADLLSSCPTCGGTTAADATEARPLPVALALLGITLAGCPRSRVEPQPEYGVPVIDVQPAYGVPVINGPTPQPPIDADQDDQDDQDAPEDADEDGDEDGDEDEDEDGESTVPAPPPPVEVRPLYGVSDIDHEIPRVVPEIDHKTP